MTSIVQTVTCSHGLPVSVAKNYRKAITGKVSVADHQRLAAILHAAKQTAKVMAVTSTLDNIVQCEHDRVALPDSVFNALYYPRRKDGSVDLQTTKAALLSVLAGAGVGKGFDPRYAPIVEWCKAGAQGGAV